MFGPDKPSSSFANVLILLVGMATIAGVQSCNVRRAVKAEIIISRDRGDEVLRLQREDEEFWRQSVRRHGRTQDMLRDVLGPTPAAPGLALVTNGGVTRLILARS